MQSAPRRRRPAPVAGFALGVVLVLAVTLAMAPFRNDVSRASPALALVVPVMVAGLIGGRAAAIATAASAAVAFSLSFIPPVGTLRVALTQDAVALGVFVVVAAAVGSLVALEADRRRAAEERADQIATMHTQYQALMSEQRHLREEADRVAVLERVDEQRSALLRSVSHDLRTPLASIRAVASDLRSGSNHTTEVRDELLDMVCDEAERLDRLVGNLLSLSRIEAGALQPERQAVALEEMVRDIAHRLSRVLGDVRLEVGLEPGLPLVDVDYVGLDQVLTNLLENAARHSPPGGIVRIHAEQTGDVVAVSVSDEGAGISADHLNWIFEPFRTYRGSSSTGIGLAICKGIVEAHGGTIEADNVPGGGAQLRFTVPTRLPTRMPTPPPTPPPTPQPTPLPAPPGPMRNASRG